MSMRRTVGVCALIGSLAVGAVGCWDLAAARTREIAPYAPFPAVLFLLAAILFLVGAGFLTKIPKPSRLQPMKPITWKWLAVGAVAIVVTTWFAASMMMSFARRATLPDERAQLEFDALKTSLTVGAGAAGAVALVLGFRRQWLSERTQSHAEFDSGEQRVTNLYTKAADQLGHEKAAVRLAGLYALERVAQNNPQHRQTIVNVFCAYLRMPLPRNPWSAPEAMKYGDDRAEPPPEFLDAARTYNEELQVREAAQAIVVNHLAVRSEGQEDELDFWRDLDLDLRGAHLRDFSLDGCRLRKADLTGAYFEGGIFVVRTEFRGVPWGTSGPSGVGGATFAACKFAGRTVFEDVHFGGDASFERATFTGDAYLGGISFDGKCDFSSAVFRGQADFEGTIFDDGADFSDSTFGGDVSFTAGLIYTEGARFKGLEVDFREATFNGSVDFSGATFAGEPISDDAAPNGSNFTKATARNGKGESRRWPDGWRDGTKSERGYLNVVRDVQ